MSELAQARQEAEEAAALAEELSDQLQEKDDLIAELRQRQVQLEDELLGSGGGGGGGSTFEAREEMRELRSRFETAEDELDKAMDTAKEQENRAKELDIQNKALQAKELQLQNSLQKAQDRIEELEEYLHQARQKTEQAAASQNKLGAREKSHKQSLIKIMAENEELRQSISTLEEEMQLIYKAFLDEQTKVKDQASQLSIAKQEVTDAEHETSEIKRLLKEKEKELTETQDELAAVAELESELEEKFKIKVEAWQEKVKVAEANLEKERKSNQGLKTQFENLKNDTGVREMEDKIKAVQLEKATLGTQLQEKKSELDKANMELLQVANELVEMKKDQGKFVDVALEKERGIIESLKGDLRAKDLLLEEEKQRYKELYEEKGRLDEDILERDFWMKQYESGHGLTEAVVYQKKLKNDIKRREKEIRRLNKELSDRLSGQEKLSETCRLLKKKCGLPEDFTFPDLELEGGMRGRAERFEALINQLEKENSDLEDERLRLLGELRLAMQNITEKGMQHMGLTGEQVVQVARFADSLREGRAELPLNDISLQLKKQLREVKQELKQCEHDLAAAELALDKSTVSRGEREGGNATVLNSLELEKHLDRITSEQASIATTLKDDLKRTLLDVVEEQKQQRQGTEPSLSGKQDPRLEQIIALLESKLVGVGSSESLNFLPGDIDKMKSELNKLSTANASLLRQLQDQRSDQVDVGATVSTSLSTAASRLNHEQLLALRLPPEEWTDTFATLHHQLVVALEQLGSEQQQLGMNGAKLREFAESFTLCQEQVKLLYREHIVRKSEWEENKHRLKSSLEEVRAERDSLQAKADRLDTLCSVLEGTEDDVRAHVSELSRKVAVYEVNEAMLARRYNLVAEEEKSIREAKELVQLQLAHSEASLQDRIVYLEEWKAGAQAELEYLSKKVEHCVPRHSHEAVLRKLKEYKHKYRMALHRETELRQCASGSRGWKRKLGQLETELSIVRSDLSQAQEHAKSLKEQLEWMKAQKPEQEDNGDTTLEDFAKLQGEVAEKAVLLGGTQEKLQVLQDRVNELEAQHAEEDKRVSSIEKRCEELSHTNESLVEQKEKLQTVLAEGASKKQKEVLIARVEELEGMYGALSREATRYKELLEVGRAQTQAMESIKACSATEMEALQTQLRQINSRSDDDAIIGKLQHQLTSTKVNYQLFARRYDSMRLAMKKLELEVRQLNDALDSKCYELSKTKEVYEQKVSSLEATLEQLEDEYGNASNTTERLEHLSETVSKLSTDNEKKEENLVQAKQSMRNLAHELETKQTELEQVMTECEDLRKALSESPEAQRGHSVAGRLLELSEELRAARRDSLRQKHELAVLEEEKRLLDRLRKKDREHLKSLEKIVAEKENEVRRYHDETRVQALPPSPKLLQSRPTNVQSPQAATDDEVLAKMKAKDEALQQLRNRLVNVEQKLQDSKVTLREREAKLERMRLKNGFLKKKLSAEKIKVDSSDGGDSDSDEETYYKKDTRHLQAAAKETIESLKQLLDRKNEQLQDYENKVEALRKTAQAEREKDSAEIQRLTERLYDENREAIQKLRTAYEDVAKGVDPNSETPSMNQEMLDRLEEADALLERKDRRVLELETQVAELRHIKTRFDQRLSESSELIARLREKLRRRPTQENSSGEGDKLRQLQAQLIGKEKKISGLRKAVIALKDEFVRAEEEHEADLIERDRAVGRENQEPSSPSRDNSIQKQLDGLRKRVESASIALRKSKKTTETLREENRELHEKLQEALADAENAEAPESNHLQETIDKLRSQNDRLKRKLRSANEQKESQKAGPPPMQNEIHALQKKIKVLEAQNAVLRSESKAASKARTPLKSVGDKSSRSANMKRWEADKKTEKRLQLLKEKLREKEHELVAARSSAEQAKQLLQRANKQKQALSRQSQNREQAVLSLRDLEESERVREKLFAAEEQIAALQREVKVQQNGEIRRLRTENDRLRRKIEGSFKELEDGPADVLALKAELVEKENTILELQFDAEESETKVARMRKRIKDLSLMKTAAFGDDEVEGKDSEDAALDSSALSLIKPSRGAGERFKRERDLEAVISALKALVKKLQGENARLRKSSNSNVKYVELGKQVKDLKEENKQLEEMKQELKKNRTSLSEMSLKVSRLSEANGRLKRHLKSKESDCAKYKERGDELTKEVTELIQETQGLKGMLERSRNDGKSVAELQRIVSQLEEEKESLSSSSSDVTKNEWLREANRLRKENERLMTELNAFDLDFFEEIEDLKYKYHQAVQENKRLRSLNQKE